MSDRAARDTLNLKPPFSILRALCAPKRYAQSYMAVRSAVGVIRNLFDSPLGETTDHEDMRCSDEASKPDSTTGIPIYLAYLEVYITSETARYLLWVFSYNVHIRDIY